MQVANAVLGWDGAGFETADRGTANKCILSPSCGESLFRVLSVNLPADAASHSNRGLGGWPFVILKGSTKLT